MTKKETITAAAFNGVNLDLPVYIKYPFHWVMALDPAEMKAMFPFDVEVEVDWDDRHWVSAPFTGDPSRN